MNRRNAETAINLAYNLREHDRRSMRLRDYDYSQAGAYFVTICTQHHECLFGDVMDGVARLNSIGDIVQRCWDDLPRHYSNIELDEFVVMPNHVHGIIVLTDDIAVGAGLRPAPTEVITCKRHGLPEIVRGLKSFSARRANELRNHANASLWQRGYYDHIVRNQQDLERIRQYIINNPGTWEEDEYNPNRRVGAGLRPAPTDPPLRA